MSLTEWARHPNWWVEPEFPRGTPFYKHMIHQLESVVDNKDSFQVSVDVKDYKPDEITITMKEDRLVIKGRHEERRDEHGFISREFVRTFTVPKDVQIDKMESLLGRDAVLRIKAPKHKQLEDKEKVIPITFEKTK